MERKIGEIFKCNGDWYQCGVAIQGCRECSFRTHGYCTHHLECLSDTRSDKTSVIFKKLEKVGEIYEENGRLLQKYKVYRPVVGINDDELTTIIEIEIKQNNEDMEEKKLNLKPFDLQKAKAGKLVCTRDGRKARIICFDRKGKQPIIALVTQDNVEEFIENYHLSGRFNVDDTFENNNDLMMLPEKKEGWVNIDKGGSGKITISSPYSTKEEAIHNDNECTIDTIKINWSE